MSAAQDGGGRAFALAVLLALLAGTWLRFTGLGDLALTHWDEGSYVAGPLRLGPYARSEPVAVYAPPLVPELNRAAFALFGPDPRAAIGSSAFLSALAIPLIALLTRRWFGAAAGAAAAVLLAFDPLHVWHARMALTESAFASAMLLTLLLLDRAAAQRSFGAALLAGMAAGTALTAKYHGPFPLAAFGLVEVLAVLAAARSFAAARARALDAARLLAAAALGLAPFAAWVALDVHRQMGFEAFLATRKVWVNGLHPWSAAATARFLATAAIEFGAPLAAALGAAGAALALVRRSRGGALGLATLLLLLAILVAYRNYVRLATPWFTLLLPFAALALAAAAKRVRRLPDIATAAAAALAVAIAAAPNLLEAVRFRGHGYPQMATLLERQLAREPGVAVFVGQHSLYPYLSRAAGDVVLSINEPEALAALRAGSANYLIADQRPFEHQRMREFEADLAPRIDLLDWVANPLPGPILLDRIGCADWAEYRADPSAAGRASETQLLLWRIRR